MLFKITEKTTLEDVRGLRGIDVIYCGRCSDPLILQCLIDNNEMFLHRLVIELKYMCNVVLLIPSHVKLFIDCRDFVYSEGYEHFFDGILCERLIEFQELKSPEIIRLLKLLPVELILRETTDDVLQNLIAAPASLLSRHTIYILNDVSRELLPSLGLLRKRFPHVYFEIRYHGKLPGVFLHGADVTTIEQLNRYTGPFLAGELLAVNRKRDLVRSLVDRGAEINIDVIAKIIKNMDDYNISRVLDSYKGSIRLSHGAVDSRTGNILLPWTFRQNQFIELIQCILFCTFTFFRFNTISTILTIDNVNLIVPSALSKQVRQHGTRRKNDALEEFNNRVQLPDDLVHEIAKYLS